MLLALPEKPSCVTPKNGLRPVHLLSGVLHGHVAQASGGPLSPMPQAGRIPATSARLPGLVYSPTAPMGFTLGGQEDHTLGWYQRYRAADPLRWCTTDCSTTGYPRIKGHSSLPNTAA